MISNKIRRTESVIEERFLLQRLALALSEETIRLILARSEKHVVWLKTRGADICRTISLQRYT